MSVKLSDESIIKMVLSGDTNTFEVLVNKYHSAVLGFAYHLTRNFADAEDLTQEAFAQAFLSLHKLNSHDRFANWLRQITANIYKMWFRQKQSEMLISIEQIRDIEFINASYQESDIDRQIENIETQDIIQKYCESLSDENRLVITLRYIDGLTYNEIGNFLDIPISTVKWRLYDARRKLKKESIEMIESELKQHGQEDQKKMLRKMMEEQIQILKHIHARLLSADKGNLYLQKRRINQSGGAQWIKVIWDDFILPEEFMVNNQQYWRVATEEDDATIKSEMGGWEDWRGRTYIYIRKKMDGGTPSDLVDIYGFNPTKAGSPTDENLNLKVCYSPVEISQELLDELGENGFEYIGRRNVSSLRIGAQWADGRHFRKVIQYQFKGNDGREAFIEIAIPSSDKSFVSFSPEEYISGVVYTGTNSRNHKFVFFYPQVEEDSAISAVWAHWGQFISISMPLGFPVYAYIDSKDPGKLGQILDIMQSFLSFFSIFADHLGYPQCDSERPVLSKPMKWKELKDWWDRRRELHPETYGTPRKWEDEAAEQLWTLAHSGISKAFYDARLNKQPTAPPQNSSIDDIGEIDLGEIRFREIHREKKDTALVGTVCMDLPEDSVQIECRGSRGKKVTIDFIKFNTDIEAGEFCWQTKDQFNSYACIDDHAPFRAFRSSHPIHKHVNAIWAEGIWLMHIRIPITKPSEAKSEQNQLPEEELREAIFVLLLKHF